MKVGPLENKMNIKAKPEKDEEILSHGKARTERRDSAGSAGSGSWDLKKAESLNKSEDGDGELDAVTESGSSLLESESQAEHSANEGSESDGQTEKFRKSENETKETEESESQTEEFGRKNEVKF